MKKRTSFVANSSSSSFIIAVKGKLTKEKIKKMINVDKLVNCVVDYIMDESMTFEEFDKKHYDYEDDEREEHKNSVLRCCDLDVIGKDYNIFALYTNSYCEDGPMNDLLHHNHEVFTGNKDDIKVGLYI